MIPKNKYIPIACSFHDILLDRATKRQKIRIEYYSDNKEPSFVDAIIKDVYTQNKEEFMQLDSGLLIRLDYIISVDGVPLPNDSSCHF